MTKKHYEAIATVVKQCHHDAMLADGEDFNQSFRVEDVAKRLADYFATENPRFDRARFLASCGIEQTKKECHHLVSTAVYNDGKLQGKKCHFCGEIVKLPNQKSQT